MSGPTTVEAKLARKPEQWRGGVPETMAAGSPAAVLYALKDAKHDVLLLLDALTQERELRKAAEGRLAHTHYWYAIRIERLKDLAKERGFWPEVAAIIANGTVTATEPPTYAQQLNVATYRAEAAEAQLAQLRKDAVEVVRELHNATNDFNVFGERLDNAKSAARIFLNANDGSDT